jgi:PAS domain S-box-containing protein
LINLDQLGRDTAAVALRILHGEPPGSIHVPALQAGTPNYDWRELQRWDIRESRLPLGSEVRFRQPNLWHAHRPRIVAVALLGLLSLLVIGVLLLALGKRRRAERLLRESEDRLNVAMAAGNVGVWAWTVSTNQIWASENWRRIFGFAPDAALSYETALARIHPEDRPGVGSALQKAIAEQSDYYGEFRVVHPAGELRWIAARARLRADRPGREPGRLVGAAVDITERKHAEQTAREFGGRLLHAQEADRARLARELHDDITQRLARLAIDAGRAETGTTDPRHKELMREVRDGLVRLSEDVHSLSYQLHPALLEDLGLTDALQAEAERFQKQEALAVDMKLAPLPERIPRDTGLCLYRVTQEALRNVARHAGTRRATVSLRPVDGGLQLAVSDPGVGFDPARQRRPSLGLASMQERVRLLGGDLDIESSPGHGTQIVAWVPLQGEMP